MLHSSRRQRRSAWASSSGTGPDRGRAGRLRRTRQPLRHRPTPALRVPAANALYNKGVTLAGLGPPADALAAYDELDRRYGTDPTPALREQAANALYNKGVTLGGLGRPADALAAYDELDPLRHRPRAAVRHPAGRAANGTPPRATARQPISRDWPGRRRPRQLGGVMVTEVPQRRAKALSVTSVSATQVSGTRPPSAPSSLDA
jgi:hypothetical protein